MQSKVGTPVVFADPGARVAGGTLDARPRAVAALDTGAAVAAAAALGEGTGRQGWGCMHVGMLLKQRRSYYQFLKYRHGKIVA